MKIIKSELEDANNRINIIKEYAADTLQVSKAIDAFSSNYNEKLSGPTWEKIVVNFTSKYNTLLSLNKQFLEELSTSIKTANNIMADYVVSFPDGLKDTLDDDGEVYEKYKKLQEEQYTLWQNSLTNKIIVGYDSNGKEKLGIEENTDAKTKYEFYKKCIQYLELLSSTDKNADAALDGVRSMIKSFSSSSENKSLFNSNFTMNI